MLLADSLKRRNRGGQGKGSAAAGYGAIDMSDDALLQVFTRRGSLHRGSNQLLNHPLWRTRHGPDAHDIVLHHRPR